MDQQANNKRSSGTEGGKVKWSDKTRGGFWVRGIEPFNSDGYFSDLRGQVGNHSDQPPSEDPTDWTEETWRSDGRYIGRGECGFDLVEVQGE
jgi:hypothetical protein